jgi:hypothetical protein
VAKEVEAWLLWYRFGICRNFWHFCADLIPGDADKIRSCQPINLAKSQGSESCGMINPPIPEQYGKKLVKTTMVNWIQLWSMCWQVRPMTINSSLKRTKVLPHPSTNMGNLRIKKVGTLCYHHLQ